MKSDNKTKNELIAELESIRKKLKKLETLSKKRKHTEQDITERLSARQTVVGLAEQACKRVEEDLITANKELVFQNEEKEKRAAELVIANKELIFQNEERKRAEEELRETRDYLENLLSFANAPIMVWDNNLRITRFNLAFERMTDYTMYDVVGKHPEILFSDDKREEISTLISRTSDGENLISVEMPVCCKDGSVRIVLWNTSNVYSADVKTIIATIALGQDITERKQAEEAIKQANGRLLLATTAGGVGIWNLDVVNNKLTWDDQMFRLYGITPDNFGSAYETWKAGVHPEDVERADAEVQMALRGEKEFDTEFRVVWPNGTIRHINARARVHRNAVGQPMNMIGTNYDITERKKAEEELQESETRYRSVLQSATDAIVTADSSGIIVGWNSGAERIFGYSYTEAVGQLLTSIMPFYHNDEHTNRMKRLQSRGDQDVIGKTVELEGLRKDKSVFPIELSLSTWETKAGQFFTGIIRDITERRQMEEGLRQMQKLEGLGTLAGGIAHDFNNILGIILAYITSTKRFKDDAKKLDLAVNTIVKAVERGKTLVQQILMFARKTETAFGAVNVNDVVMEIMTMIMETFPKILTYTQTFDKSITFINADRSQLHQVLLNLCVNARDAMPKGGVLTINTRMVSVASLRTHHPDAAASSYVCIEVSDTGEGMTEETRKRIFEPFFTTKDIGKGTGLGLSVVFGIVQTHKGYIDVESELGKGTTFRLYLPASQVAAPISVKDEETLEEILGGTETLLVVEDEEMLMMSLRLVLAEKGYNVLSTGDGLTALKIYQEKKDDVALVLTDLGLPTMTGMEVCQRIKTIKPNEHIILATGYLDPEMKEEFLKAGIQHFLYKPYDLKQVLKEVREVLDEK
jgi:two-component system, cell cycle sensor histidine kinase and response regulator CckA